MPRETAIGVLAELYRSISLYQQGDGEGFAPCLEYIKFDVVPDALLRAIQDMVRLLGEDGATGCK